MRSVPGDSLPVYVCMPYRERKGLVDSYNRAMSLWESFDYNVINADSNPHLPFSLAEARNNCVRQITEENAIIIVSDADTIPEWSMDLESLPWIEESFRYAKNGRVVYPFSDYCYMRKEHVLLDPLTVEPIWVKRNSVGGCLVTSKKAYWNLGGMDERFERTWGYEDNAFYMAAETLSTVIRLPGRIFSFEHEVEGGRIIGQRNPNFWRNELYKAAFEKPEMMRELLKR